MASRQSNFFTELNNKFPANKKKYYYYFMWVNKLSNSATDFSNITEEEFKDKYLKKKVGDNVYTGEKSLNALKMWESTPEYQNLMQEYYCFKMTQDFYKLYETYLGKAMEGDAQSVNVLKTIKKEIESLNKPKTVTKSKPEEEKGFDMSRGE